MENTISRSCPRLFIVIPCYNEEEVLPLTAPKFLGKINQLINSGMISSDSRILFVNDGSNDRTWDLITEMTQSDEHFLGMSLSRNRGHQNALLAGLMEARTICDATISIDCDGQDDINAMDEMVKAFSEGADIVYGVRSNRDSDTFFKRFTAESFYKLISAMGVETVFNSADYRLTSAVVLNAFADYKDVNLFLRGMFPLVGYKSTSVYYERHERLAGESHYPLSKMLKLAEDGITSLSVKPLRFVSFAGAFVMVLSLIMLLITTIRAVIVGVAAWIWVLCVLGLLSGLQLLCMGILAEYVGKIHQEVKAHPRYIVSKRSWKD